MASAPVPRDRGDFHIVIICALKQEAECVCDVLDTTWDTKNYGQASSDDNAYTLGTIGEHNVIVIHMPGMGTDRATAAVTSLRSSFEHVKLALVVGVCGGMPYGRQNEEIVLGDVVISEALVRYDFGKQYSQGFKRKTEIHDVLGPPAEKILSLLQKLQTKQARAILQDNTATFLEDIQQKSPRIVHPGSQDDILYHSSYAHQHHAPERCDMCENGHDVCEDAIATRCEDLGCDPGMHVTRRRLTDSSSTSPKIHFGTTASGNTVMKSGHHRDALAKEGVIAVEMEGAGVWRSGPTIVIKGVCDYADSHKRKEWQPYAAATAAACTKAFLLEWVPEKRQDNPGELSTSADTSATGLGVSAHPLIRAVDSRLGNMYFNVPEHQVEILFGREDELMKIANYFDHARRQIGRPRMLVLQGMGGQGKSQIALEHCHCTHARHTHRGIFWLDGTSGLTSTQSWLSIAQQISGSATEPPPDDDARVKGAIRTLEEWSHRWLIVFDNCDDATTFSTLRQKFLPKVGKGDILFTSRHRGLGELGHLMEIPPMPDEAGVKLLLHRHTADDHRREHITKGLQIVKRLGGLALAIDQASAYMQYKRLPLDQLDTFLPSYLVQREKVLEHTTSEVWNYMKVDGVDEQQIAVSAFTTWEMSFQQLLDQYQDQTEVAHFFTLSAFFGLTFVNESLFRLHWERHGPSNGWMRIFKKASETIPRKDAAMRNPAEDGDTPTPAHGNHVSAFLRPYKRFVHRLNKRFHHTMPRETVSLQPSQAVDRIADPGLWDPDYFWDLIRQASQLSLLQDISPATESTGASLLFHPLIRDWLQLRLATIERQAYTREAIHILVSSIRAYDARSSDAQMRTAILLHMNAALVCDAEFFSDEDGLGCDMSTCGDAAWYALFYHDHGRYSASLRLYQQVSTTTTRVLGADHPSTLGSMNDLATALRNQGEYSKAEQMYRQVLEVSERVLDADHPSTLTYMNNFAGVLRIQSKHSKAEQIYRQVLEARKRVLGAEHPSTLTSMNNLALVLDDQGEYSEAEQIHRQVLEARKRVLGAEHPSTLTCINNLALVLYDQGEYREAEQIHRQVLEARKRVLGAKHPSTLTSMNNLAGVLDDQGKYSEAEQIYRQVLEVSERVLGAMHPHTLIGMNNLAGVLANQGEYREAERLQTQAVRSAFVAPGSQHPDTSVMLDGLTAIWKRSGRETSEIERARQDILDEFSSS